MINSMIISTVLLMIVVLAVLFRAFRHAAEGYEDEFGFHPGSDSQGKRIRIPAGHAAMAREAPANRAVRVKSLSARARRKLVDQGSTAPF
jgi:hypothetical protein